MNRHHSPLQISIPRNILSTTPFTIILHNFLRADFDGINIELMQNDWIDTFLYLSVEDMTNLFYEKLNYLIDKYVPVYEKTIHKYPP